MNRKCIVVDHNMLHQRAFKLYEDFSKGSPETSNTNPFTTKDYHIDSGTGVD